MGSEESDVQRQVKNRALQIVSELLHDKVMKHQMGTLAQLMRCRQAACHSSLIAHIDVETLEAFSDELREWIFNTNVEFKEETVADIKSKIINGMCPICQDDLNANSCVTKCGHIYCQDCITTSFEKNGYKCPECR